MIPAAGTGPNLQEESRSKTPVGQWGLPGPGYWGWSAWAVLFLPAANWAVSAVELTCVCDEIIEGREREREIIERFVVCADVLEMNAIIFRQMTNDN